ncbi:MAG: SirB2 family protein [Pseudomonadota bacterium]
MFSYTLIKTIHALTALISIAGFLLRGYWMLTANPMLQAKLTRVLPHVVDTLFLLTGIVLLIQLGGSPLTQTWMLLKIGGLVVYIVLGTIAIKRGRTLAIRTTALIAALLVFAYIYGIALSKSAASWLQLV